MILEKLFHSKKPGSNLWHVTSWGIDLPKDATFKEVSIKKDGSDYLVFQTSNLGQEITKRWFLESSNLVGREYLTLIHEYTHPDLGKIYVYECSNPIEYYANFIAGNFKDRSFATFCTIKD